MKDLSREFDCEVWADEFIKVVNNGAEIDKGLMLGWFANAINAGYDVAWDRFKTGEFPV